MGVVLDTSVLIAAERGNFDLDALIASPAVDAVAVAAITISELLRGTKRTTSDAIRVRRAAFTEWLLSGTPVLPFGLLEARQHADLFDHLRIAGTPINTHDALIAATALASGLDVATLDRKHFSRVPGLGLVDVAPFVRA